MKNYPYSLLYGLLFTLLLPVAVFSQSSSQAVILQYHHVSTETPASTSLSSKQFEAHMTYLKDNGFSILPLPEVITALNNQQQLPDKTIVITFDDGYTSVYQNAYPVLKQLNWPFTILVTTGLIDNNPGLYASWDQLREMADNGATIANHTVTHPYLLELNQNESKQAWLNRVVDEINSAENTIKSETGHNYKILAYPYGEHDENLQTLINEMGYIGLAQNSGAINENSDFSALPRFPMSGIYASINSFSTKVHSLAFNKFEFTPASPITQDSRPALEVQFFDNQPGLEQLSCYHQDEAIEITEKTNREDVFEIETSVSNSSRRFRFNCTAPGENGRYYWLSKQWINPTISD